AVVRDLLRPGADGVRTEGPVPQRRPVRGGRVSHAGDPHRSDDADLRPGADGGVDRTRARAVRGQPDHPAGLGVRRAPRPDLRPHRGGTVTDQDPGEQQPRPPMPASAPPPAMPGAPPAAAPATNGIAVAALVCGVLSIVLFFTVWIPIVLGVLAIVF